MLLLKYTRAISNYQQPLCRAVLAAARHASRHVWNERLDQQEALKADSFYDSTVEKYAEMPIETFSLEQMLNIGRNVISDPSKVIQSANFVHRELPKR